MSRCRASAFPRVRSACADAGRCAWIYDSGHSPPRQLLLAAGRDRDRAAGAALCAPRQACREPSRRVARSSSGRRRASAFEGRGSPVRGLVPGASQSGTFARVRDRGKQALFGDPPQPRIRRRRVHDVARHPPSSTRPPTALYAAAALRARRNTNPARSLHRSPDAVAAVPVRAHRTGFDPRDPVGERLVGSCGRRSGRADDDAAIAHHSWTTGSHAAFSSP